VPPGAIHRPRIAAATTAPSSRRPLPWRVRAAARPRQAAKATSPMAGGADGGSMGYRAGTAMAVSRYPQLASQRPAKPVSGNSPTTGAVTSSSASKTRGTRSMVTSASANSSMRRTSGNQALYTDSLALNSKRSQLAAGAAVERSRSARTPRGRRRTPRRPRWPGVCRSGLARGWPRLIYAEAARFPDLYDAIRETGSDPILDALAGRLARLSNAGHLDIADPYSAAGQFLALISGDLPALSALGTRPVEREALERAVTAGVETFLRAFAPRR
jgi:hypothetical protein